MVRMKMIIAGSVTPRSTLPKDYGVPAPARRQLAQQGPECPEGQLGRFASVICVIFWSLVLVLFFRLGESPSSPDAPEVSPGPYTRTP
jgi:hypothetical protein